MNGKVKEFKTSIKRLVGVDQARAINNFRAALRRRETKLERLRRQRVACYTERRTQLAKK